jgi:signal transduction histidine kinase
MRAEPLVYEDLRFDSARVLLELARGTGAEWDSWIQNLCQFEADVLHVDRVSFWSIADAASCMTCDAGFVAGTREFEHGAVLIASDVPAFFEAIREVRALRVEDVHGDPRLAGLDDYCTARGVSSLLDVPVWAEGRLAGVLCHEQVGTERRWTGAEQDFAVGVGQVVASALSARAHTRAEAEARRSSFLDTVSRTVTASLDTHEIARRALDVVVPRLADVAVVWMAREGRLECLGWTCADPRKVATLAELERDLLGKREGPFAKRVFRQKQAVLVPDVQGLHLDSYELTPEERASLEVVGIRAGMGVPLGLGGEPLGAFVFYSMSRHFDAGDRALAEDIGARVATALENARMYGVAQEAIRARDEFLSLVAHELRTPLTALQLRTDCLLRQARRSRDSDGTKRAEGIARDVRRFAEVVEHALEASTLRTESPELERVPCDLSEIVAACVGRMAEKARAAGSPLDLQVEPSIVARVDRARIERVLLCLLDNAIKFGDKKPIDVALRRVGSEADLTVRDHGAGISHERLPFIFEPFERAVSREHFGGLGMGLYIARAIVEAHGGTIAATSAAGGGATFVVRLPL